LLQSKLFKKKKVSILVDAEIERQRRVLGAQAIKEQEFLEIEARARAVEAVEIAKAKGVAAHLQAEAEYVKAIVSGCGNAEGATRYRLVDKVPALAKYSAEAVKNIKFDKVVVWDRGNGDDGKNATANFIQNLVGSVAPVGDLVKNVLGVDMAQYLGSLAQKNNSEITEIKTEEKKHKEKTVDIQS